jgi:integrase
MSAWARTTDSRVKKRDGKYWARFSKKGKRVEVALGTKNFEVAKKITDEIEAKIHLGKSWKRERQLFSEAWLEFLIDKKSGNKVRAAREKTLSEYTAFGLRYFIPFFGDMTLGEIGDAEWTEFLAWIKKEFGAIQLFNIVKYMNGFYTWVEAHGKGSRPYLFNPDAKAQSEAEEVTPKRALTLDELKRIREVCADHERLSLVVLVMQYMGMRPSEVTQLRRDRIDLAAGVIKLRKVDTKTNTARVVPIHERVVRPLKDQLLAHSSPFLFPHAHDKNSAMDREGLKRAWRERIVKSGVECKLYDIRHAFITHAIAQGVMPSAVARICGTSIRVIEKHYLHLSPEFLGAELKRLRL